MSATKTGVHYAWIAAGVMGAVAVVAWLVQDQWLAFSAAILGLYVLHLVSVRYIVRANADQLAALTGLNPASPALSKPNASGSNDADAPGMLSEAGPELEPEASKAAFPEASEAALDAIEENDESDSDEGTDLEAADAVLSAEDADEDPEPAVREVAIPRHFMLGTVAIVRSVMEPEAVARVLMEQRQQPGKRFGELAVAMGLISEDQLEMLLEAQQRGLFTDAEIREARQRLETFRRAQTEPAASA